MKSRRVLKGEEGKTRGGKEFETVPMTNLGACDHGCVAEAKVKNCFTVMDQCVQHLPTVHIPHSVCMHVS